MNLLMISGDRALVSGKRGAFFNTLEEFSKYWDRIDIICPRPLGEINPLPNVFLHPSPWPIIFQIFWINKKGGEILRERNISVMTVHDYPPFYNGLGARILAHRTKLPYLEELFHIVGYPRAANMKEYMYRVVTHLFIKFVVAEAKKIRVMNVTQVPQFLKSAGVPENKIEYIPAIYLDEGVFKDLNLKREYDIIFVGRIAENKGIGVFLEAIRNLSVRALIVGDGPLKNKFEHQVKKWGISHRVTFRGWVLDSREIARFMNMSKILVAPSYNEGGPRVVIEAMACGTAVLATPVGIVPDLVKNGYPTFLADWSSDGLGKKISEVLSNPLLCQNAQKIGKELAQKFNRELSIKFYATQVKMLVNHE